MKPELEVISTKTERLLKTDSVGWDDPSLAGAKEDFNDSFDTEDNLWDYSTKKDIWK